jgi:hypothetical protein
VHPDYAADCAAVEARSSIELDGVKFQIAHLPMLERKANMGDIADAISTRGSSFLVDESDSGKRTIAAQPLCK